MSERLKVITISTAEAPGFLDGPARVPASGGGSQADPRPAHCRPAPQGTGARPPGGGAARPGTGRWPPSDSDAGDGDALQGLPRGRHLGDHGPDRAGTPATPGSLPPLGTDTQACPARTLKPLPTGPREGPVVCTRARARGGFLLGSHVSHLSPLCKSERDSSPGARSKPFFMKFPKGRKIHFASLYFFLLI